MFWEVNLGILPKIVRPVQRKRDKLLVRQYLLGSLDQQHIRQVSSAINNKQNATQITADAKKNYPFRYSGILRTSVKGSHSLAEVPLRKQSKLEAWNLNFKPCSPAKASK
jgi:hypothetical protein